jgi:transposase
MTEVNHQAIAVASGFFSKLLKPFYSTIGRPSIDPELMMRMLIVGYCMGIRSERRLCDEIHLNLAYRWFCRLGLDGKVPDHSTFSRNRHGRFPQSDILWHLFEAVVGRCLREGLVGGEGGAVDASRIAADANKQRPIPGDQWRVDDLGADAGQAIREYLATLDDAAFGAASEVTPKFISPSDPAAQWTGACRKIRYNSHLERGNCHLFFRLAFGALFCKCSQVFLSALLG